MTSALAGHYHQQFWKRRSLPSTAAFAFERQFRRRINDFAEKARLAHSDILTREEYETTAINPEILRYLEYARIELGLQKGEMNVLDWGCGRGNHVLLLREQGYNAFGVEPSQETADLGKGLIGEMGYDPDRLLGCIDPDGKAAHPDQYFHFVFSNQVLEHVEDIDQVTREISRLTKSGCFGFHIYPGRWRPIEVHLFMPFVHWLPKNAWRHWAIRACVSLGIEPHWKELEGLSAAKKADCYCGYSNGATFYRPYQEIADSFKRAGHSVKPVVMDHPLLRPFQWVPGRLIERLVLAFRTVEILTRRHG